MNNKSVDEKIISARPAKRFFVEMLTRDIELADAILDLLDNCLDGAMRSSALLGTPIVEKQPYKDYWAKITLNGTNFKIEDNCGGIPLVLAREKAFRFGRPDSERDNDINTVGVYGIGMKRALFKLGTDFTVLSNHEEGSFGVHIDEKWINGDEVWELEMDRTAVVPSEKGVTIEVKKLHPQIQNQFSPIKGNFEETLKIKIRDHYAYILKKGFSVSVNGKDIKPIFSQTLISSDLTQGGVIAPYVYRAEHEGVTVNLVMGMYERFPSDSEIDDYYEGTRSKKTAGWTVVCNDRVVLSNDITHMTGWGDGNVPVYHSQYVMLSGIVEFTSVNASKLPVTTTKRGIDLSSALYNDVKGVMREALKHFTSFTNQWKSQNDERTNIQTATMAIDIRDAAMSIPEDKWQQVRKGIKGERFVPDLPKPKQEKTHARITYNKLKSEIKAVENFLFDPGTNPKPTEVGEAAFDWVLKESKE
jgi:hypothetical protein